MYVTRPLSHYIRFPEALSSPPEGPNSGYLVIQDEESQTYCCFGLCKNEFLEDLPFPQNKIQHVSDGDNDDAVAFIPVLNKPLSSNHYYAIKPHSKHQGRKGWQIYGKTPKDYELGKAPGLNSALFACLPEFNFPMSYKSSKSIIVGKWYCPFIFIKDEPLSDQMKQTMFYEMRLKQRWEQIYSCENNFSEGNKVFIDVAVQTEVVSVASKEALSLGNVGGRVSVGLRVEIVQRMKCKQERAGWLGGEDKQAMMKRVEEFGEVGEWRKFGCYVLVERFILKRMDGNLSLLGDLAPCSLDRDEVLGNLPWKQLLVEQSLNLTRDVTDEEVKRAVFSIHPNKAPGPDGFNVSGESRSVSHDDVAFIPVLNLLLYSNRYYAIKPHGNHKGEAYTSSREEDKATGLFGRSIRDVKSRPLDPHDIYQQFDIALYETSCTAKGYFYAKSVAPDGFPPSFLRAKGWQIYGETPKNYELGEAPGLNAALRTHLPEFNFPISYKSSESVVVGKWYCPFIFIKDGNLRDQTKRSMFYEMTLEQRWEQIFASENNSSEGNSVFIDVAVQTEVVSVVAGKETVWNEREVVDGAIWFRSFGKVGEGVSVGLRVEIVERMKWEQERAGWVGGEDRQARVKRVEEFGGIGGWRKFGCYVLVERFVLKRMDGSLVTTCDFKHTHQIKSKWE
ncbi:unnamed protein product [Ilex paraguariensis]|uniref:Uncharacterized protein n=1 Tax=Ilex paraguariensis TaxID=185542 RepID=A0ABC8SQV3_9AQUA